MGFARRFRVFAPALLALFPSVAHSQLPVVRPALRMNGRVQTSVSSDTVGVGFLATSADPNKVGVGGAWDFDTAYYAGDISGTDSTQFWTFIQAPNQYDGTYFSSGPYYRPQWYYDYGNNINVGDHNLWVSRAAAHRIFRRTGLAGVWHQDNLSTVPDTGTVVPGFATNLSGSGSAWCGLRLCGDPNAPTDPYTGNSYTSEQQYSDFRQNSTTPRSAYPGYAAQWDQLMYRDFPYNPASPGAVAFDYRAELDSVAVGDPGGSAWFTPDPFDLYNMVAGSGAAEPVDSFEVWVGAPQETGIYDPAHRYLSDTIDFGLGGADAPKMILSMTGVRTGSAAPAIPGGASWSTVRVVFRVKTNRFFDDRAPSTAPTGTGFNSTTGAVALDNVNVNGMVSDFESASQIRPRFTWIDLGGGAADITENSPSATWITTGRQPARYGHVENVGNLPYNDPAGGTMCNLAGNIALQSDHDDPQHDFVGESQNYMISPTICLTGPRAADQGIPATLRTEANYIKMVFDFYPGDDDIGQTGILFQVGVRCLGTAAGSKQVLGPKSPAWTGFLTPGAEFGGYSDSTCITFETGQFDMIQIPLATTDSLQVCIQNQLRCQRFQVPACGAVRGYYMDNIQVQFVRNQPFTGVDLGPRLDFVRGAYPNPSPDGSATVKFSLRQAVPVTLRFYDLRGALVHEATVDGQAGENSYRWEGTTRTGLPLASGVYFYRLYADGVEFRNNAQRVVFVGAPAH